MNQDRSAGPNRRAAARRAARANTKVICRKGTLGLGPNLAVSALDVSETGIRLLVSTALESGQTIEVELSRPAIPRPIKLAAEVIWSVATADGRYCIGARFQRRLSYADFQQLT